MDLKLAYFLYHNLILFSERNYKIQAQIFYQNHSLALHTAEILYNLILRNHWKITEKISDCLTGLGLTLWYFRLGLKKCLYLWCIGVKIEKYCDYLTGFGLSYTILDLNFPWPSYVWCVRNQIIMLFIGNLGIQQ